MSLRVPPLFARRSDPVSSPRREAGAGETSRPTAAEGRRGTLLGIPASTPSAIGGYRVVRRLGGGATATVLLGRGGDRSVALRCYRDGVPDARIDAEVESLSRLRSRHLVALRDLATGPDGRTVLILDPVIGPSLHDLLAARHGALDPGEAVTVLAPLVELVNELHEVGVVVGRWSPAGIRIGADGAPVLTALSGLAAAPPLPPRFRSQEPGVLADLDGLRSVGEQVAGAVRSDRRDALLGALGSVDDPVALERALFDAARPAPLVLELAALVRPVGQAARALGSSETPVERVGSAGDHPRARGSGALRGTVLRVLDDLGLPAAVLEPLRAGPVRLPTMTRRPLRRRREAAAPAGRSEAPPAGGARSSGAAGRARPRRSVLLAGAGGGLALLAAVALLALDGDDPGSASAPSSTVEAPTGPDRLDDGPPQESASRSTDAAAAGDADPQAEDGAGPAYADSGTDPSPEEWIELVAELAVRWTDCRVEVLDGADHDDCAAEVVQPGSAAEVQLVAPTGMAVDDALSPAPTDAVVVDRLGSAVLIDLIGEAGTRTASLLVVRSEAGWRIRSVLG